MAVTNPYYEFTPSFIPGTKVRSDAVNTQYAALQTAFDLLPSDVGATTTGRATFGTESGSGNVYAVAPADARTIDTDGDEIVFVATHTNTGAATLNVDGNGARTFIRADGSALEANDIVSGLIYVARFDFASTAWQLIGPSASYLTNAAASAAASAASAVGSAASAVTSATEASASAVSAAAALASEAAALDSETDAMEWAVNAIDDDITDFPGQFSALHWADGAAQAWAIQAEDSAIQVSFGGDASTTFSAFHWAQKALLFSGAYFTLAATNRVIGSDASGSTGDNVIIGGAGAGAANIADNVIALGVGSLAAAAQLDFEGSVVVGHGAAALIDDTRDPIFVMGWKAFAAQTGAGFHDGITVIGTEALGNYNSSNLQALTAIGHRAGFSIAAGGSLASTTIIGYDAVGSSAAVIAAVTNCVVIGRDAVGTPNAAGAGVADSVYIGVNAGEFAGNSETRVTAVGYNVHATSGSNEDDVFIGANVHGHSSATNFTVAIGSGAAGTQQISDQNVIVGAQAHSVAGVADLSNAILIGFNAGNDLITSGAGVLAIESTLATGIGAIRPYLWGDTTNSNLAILSIADTSTGVETGTRLLPTWGSAQGVFTMSGAGTDLGATTDANFMHFWIRNADSTLMLRDVSGNDMGISSLGLEGPSGIVNIRSLGNTDSEQRLIQFTHNDGVTLVGNVGQLGVSGIMRMSNFSHGDGLFLSSEDAGGNTRNGFSMDPDTNTFVQGDTVVALQLAATADLAFEADAGAGARVYFNDIARVSTLASGVFAIRSDTSTDSEVRSLEFQHQDGTIRGSLGNALANLTLANQIHAGHIVLSAENTAGTPVTLFTGDPDAATTIQSATDVALTPGSGDIIFTGTARASNAAGPAVIDAAPTGNAPTLVPNRNDANTGIGWNGNDVLSLVAGGIEVLRVTETGSTARFQYSMDNFLTASITQTQGLGPIDGSFAEFNIVANDLDTGTLPAASTGLWCSVINSGVSRLQLFPFSGDDLGEGLNLPTTILPLQSKTYMAISGTVWREMGHVSRNNFIQENSASQPTVSFGDGDTGFYESADDTLELAVGGEIAWTAALNGATDLYYNAIKTLGTGVATGLVYSTGNTTNETRRIQLVQQNGTLQGQIGQINTIDFQIRNEIANGLFRVIGSDTGGADANIIIGDPNGALDLYANDAIGLSVETSSRVFVRGAANIDAAIRELDFTHQDGTIVARMGMTAAEVDLSIQNEIATGDIALKVVTSELVLHGAANGTTGIYHDGAVHGRTVDTDSASPKSVGFEVQTPSNFPLPVKLAKFGNTNDTTTYTFDIDDCVGLIRISNTTNKTWTIPPQSAVNFDPGDTIQILRDNATGTLTISPGSGVSIRWRDNGSSGTGSHDFGATANLYEELILTNFGSNVWYVRESN